MAVSAVAIVLAACRGSNSPFGRADRRIRVEPSFGASPASVAAAAAAFPVVSCIDTVRERRAIFEVAAVAPPGYRRITKAQDEGWFPSRLSGLAVPPDGYVVLDAPAGRLTRFSADFTERHQWGRVGEGPGELGQPSALALGPSGREVWVLDNRPTRLVAFDLQGRYLRTIPLQEGGAELAIDAAGRFYVGHAVFRDRVRSDPQRFGALVTIIGADGQSGGVLVRLTEGEWRPPRIVLPWLVEPRVVAAGDRVAVIYPASGVVDVFRNGRHEATVHACLPSALQAAYDRQRHDWASGRSQEWASLITDVLLDLHGGIWTVGPLKDSTGQYHVDAFNAQGQARGSVALPGQGIRLPPEVRFAGDSLRLVAFSGGEGVIAVFELRSTQLPRIR